MFKGNSFKLCHLWLVSPCLCHITLLLWWYSSLHTKTIKTGQITKWSKKNMTECKGHIAMKIMFYHVCTYTLRFPQLIVVFLSLTAITTSSSLKTLSLPHVNHFWQFEIYIRPGDSRHLCFIFMMKRRFRSSQNTDTCQGDFVRGRNFSHKNFIFLMMLYSYVVIFIKRRCPVILDMYAYLSQKN